MQEWLCAIKLKNLILINFVTVFGMDIFVNVHANMIPIYSPFSNSFRKANSSSIAGDTKRNINLNGGSLSPGAHVTWIKFLVVDHTFFTQVRHKKYKYIAI